jgi:hypothetical protein
MKTLAELNQKPWYRFFKVVYVIMWLPYPLLLYALSTIGEGPIKGCLIMTLLGGALGSGAHWGLSL